MLYDIRTQVHERIPLISVDQHVDDLVLCARGRQSVVIRNTLETTKFILFLTIDPPLFRSKLKHCCGEDFGGGCPFPRHAWTRDLGPDTGGSDTRVLGVSACARRRNGAGDTGSFIVTSRKRPVENCVLHHARHQIACGECRFVLVG